MLQNIIWKWQVGEKSIKMMQQCPGKENGSHLGVSSIVPKLLQVLSKIVSYALAYQYGKMGCQVSQGGIR